MILVDTSAWIDFFRDAAPIAEAVDEALVSNRVAWCGPVEAELRRGFRTRRERDRVLPLLDACWWLPQPEALWSDAGDLGFALRRRGLTCKTMDLLIATYAMQHDVPLLTADADFRRMVEHGAPLRLV